MRGAVMRFGGLSSCCIGSGCKLKLRLSGKVRLHKDLRLPRSSALAQPGAGAPRKSCCSDVACLDSPDRVSLLFPFQIRKLQVILP